jgi:very-short-patch-repair endonuclease
MGGPPDPDWYLDHVLVDAAPRGGMLASGAAPQWAAQQWAAQQWAAWWDDRARSGDAVVRMAARQGFVLTTAQLAALAVPRQPTRTAVRRERWVAPARGVVAPLTVIESGASPLLIARRRHALAAAAAALLRPEHVVSGRSAAVLHGLPTFAVPGLPVLTAREPVGLGHRGTTTVRLAGLRDADVATWFGVPVTSVARTVVDLARHDGIDGLIAADAALHDQLVETSEVDAVLAAARGWPGVRRARSVLALASPLAESPLESLVRLRLHDAGLPPPELQVWIPGTSYRVDMLLADHRLIIEADGRVKYSGDELWAEKRRETRLRALGYRVERLLWEDVVRRWPETRRRLLATLRLPA